MASVSAPAQLAYDAACCCVLGAILGALRALLPAKGRAAFLPDMLLVGALLLLAQSYAAAYSGAGVLRWYMAAGGAFGALAAQGALTKPFALARRALACFAALPLRLLAKKVLRPSLERRRARAERAKACRSVKISSKMHKKSLQKHRHLLYNSNV